VTHLGSVAMTIVFALTRAPRSISMANVAFALQTHSTSGDEKPGAEFIAGYALNSRRYPYR
jgi:hypothetical protein